jgi:hypothetical protein
MKVTSLILGLLFATGAHLLVGAPAKDVQLSTPPRKDSPPLADKGNSPAPAGPQTGTYGPNVLDDTVLIVSVTEQTPDASGRRKVTVRVHYALLHYPKGVLSLGFNLKSATRVVPVTERSVMAGTEEVELSASIVPVTWPRPSRSRFRSASRPNRIPGGGRCSPPRAK